VSTKDRCPACNVPDQPWCWLGAEGACDRLADEKWARHNVARSPAGPNLPPASPARTPPTAPPTPAAVRDLRARMLACPHRGPHACGCGALAVCALGKGSLGTVDHHDCRECLLAQDREGSGS
jgi:hypothetical protein